MQVVPDIICLKQQFVLWCLRRTSCPLHTLESLQSGSHLCSVCRCSLPKNWQSLYSLGFQSYSCCLCCAAPTVIVQGLQEPTESVHLPQGLQKWTVPVSNGSLGLKKLVHKRRNCFGIEDNTGSLVALRLTFFLPTTHAEVAEAGRAGH